MQKPLILVVASSTAIRAKVNRYLKHLSPRPSVHNVTHLKDTVPGKLQNAAILFGPEDFDGHAAAAFSNPFRAGERVAMFVRENMPDDVLALARSSGVELFPLSAAGADRQVVADRLALFLGMKTGRTGAGTRPGPALTDVTAIAIGASTGGVAALETVFSQLVCGMPPILIVQHTKSETAERLARILDRAGPVNVQEAETGAHLRNGHAYIAGDLGKHLVVCRRDPARIELVAEDPVSGHRPSIDRLFSSMGRLGPCAVGVLLTGMGRDGADGLKHMRENGSWTISQDANSALVNGMPQAASELGAVRETLSLEQIANRLRQTQTTSVHL